ncbi:MAG: hypothetical protein K6L80_11905 [Agarilytica sp.]
MNTLYVMKNSSAQTHTNYPSHRSKMLGTIPWYQSCWLRIAFSLCLASIILPVHAATDADKSIDLSLLYNDYEKSGFAVVIPVRHDIQESIAKRLSRLRYQLLYVSKAQIENNNTIQLTIGYFSSETEADRFAHDIRHAFPSRFVKKIDENEFLAVLKQAKAKHQQNNQSVFLINNEHSMRGLLEEAKIAFTKKNYQLAKKYYQILGLSFNRGISEWAYELLGLAEERSGNHAKALAIYQKLSTQLEDGGTKTRVTQRLNTLSSAKLSPKSKLRSVKDRGAPKNFNSHGFISQTFRTLSTTDTNNQSEKIYEALSNDYDFRATYNRGIHTLSTRLNGYYIKDQLEDEDSFSRLHRFHINYKNQDNDLSATIGRQKNRDNGTFFSFDGVSASYPISERTTVGASFGTPDYRSDVYDSANINFYGLHSTTEFNNNVSINGYLVHQTVESVVDRHALGTSLRYRSRKLNTYLNLDYDIEFDELNNLLWSSTYIFNKKSTLTSTIGLQRSPFLTATNFIIGQADIDIENYLESEENRDSIHLIAEQKTAINKYLNLSYTKKVSDRTRLVSDIYLSDLEDQRPEESEEPSLDSSYKAVGLQILVDGKGKLNHMTSFGSRYSTSNNSKTSLIFINERIRIKRKLFVTPKVSYFMTKNATSDQHQTHLRYSVNLKYRHRRNTQFYLDIGGEKSALKESDISTEYTYFNLGYTYRF